jgi:aldehyde dehydrogenase (NAD+)
VFESSDLPGGVVNIVTGAKDVLAKTLAEHDDVEGMWYWGGRDGVKAVEYASASNMKRTWCHATSPDWFAVGEGEGREYLREATQVKNIWVPYGE